MKSTGSSTLPYGTPLITGAVPDKQEPFYIRSPQVIWQLLTYQEPRQPASWVVYRVQTSCRVELAPEQWRSQPQPLGFVTLLPTVNWKSPSVRNRKQHDDQLLCSNRLPWHAFVCSCLHACVMCGGKSHKHEVSANGDVIWNVFRSGTIDISSISLNDESLFMQSVFNNILTLSRKQESF